MSLVAELILDVLIAQAQRDALERREACKNVCGGSSNAEWTMRNTWSDQTTRRLNQLHVFRDRLEKERS